MKYIYRVARREYGENVATKGFWIGIFLFPLMIMVGIKSQGFLAKATPTRHYVLLDQSGAFEATIADSLEALDDVALLEALMTQVRTQQSGDAPDPKMPNLNEMPADALEEMQTADAADEIRKAFSVMETMMLAAGGAEADAIREQGFKEYLLSTIEAQDEEFERPKRKFKRVPLPDGIDPTTDLETLAQELRPYLRGQKTYEVDGESIELFAAILLPPDVEEHVERPASTLEAMATAASAMAGAVPDADTKRRGIQYWSSNLADDALRKQVTKAVNQRVRTEEYENRGVDPAIVERVSNTELPVSALNPRKDEGKEEVTLGDKLRQWAPVAFVYLLWIGIFTISQMLLNNTIEEKSNRIIEVLLSSVTPSELMLGKLFGIATVGLTMLASWILSLLLILKLEAGGAADDLARQILDILQTSGLLPWFAVYFMLGYFMYAAIFLAIGSVCNTLKEAQNLMGPVMLIMAVPLFTMMFIPKDPNGTLATALSWVPLYTPFIMMNRVEASPPLFDTVGTLILLVVSTIVALWLCGRIFRTGILRTGQPPKITELWRWIRSSG